MTEPKRTLSLNPRQWRVLLHDNLKVLMDAVVATESINEDALKQICTQLDDMKMLAGAWFQVGQPAKETATADAPAQVNGAAVPKRRGRPPKAAQEQVVQ